ncbi:MAG: hypothetical protein Q4F49_07285 [Pseudoxanthomonas suwonensis]|nr:hypothetical protein [Pseudoxanthomonas suwonensis]
MRWSVPLLLMLALLAWPAHARTLRMEVDRVDAPMAQLDDVHVRLHWPDGAVQGALELRAARLRSDTLGYRWRHVRWQCPLQRDGRRGWHCDGPVQAAGQSPARLRLHLAAGGMTGELQQGGARVRVTREDATPELTRIDLAAVPAAWVQALARKAWTDVQLQDGRVDAQVRVHVPAGGPVNVNATMDVAGLSLQNADASIAAERLGGRLRVDWLAVSGGERITVDGQLQGGEFLAGNTYVAMPDTPVDVAVQARRTGDGWALSALRWDDGAVLQMEGEARLNHQARLDALQLRARSRDLRPLRERYLSGWMGMIGLDGTTLAGAADLDLGLTGGRLQHVHARLHGVSLDDPRQRFGLDDLQGDVRFTTADAPANATLRWRAASLYGLQFGAAALPLASSGGELRLREAVDIPLFGGTFRIDGLALRPPANGGRLGAEFALQVEDVDFGRLTGSLGLPEFAGTMHGFLPRAVFQDDVLRFDGGLSMALFDGAVQFSELSLERPFGPAPSLGTDIDLRGIDLDALTSVLDIGGVTGRMDGRIHGLRLVDWTPVAFDAWLHTVPRRGVRQRISQRAVQDISSVGDASFAGSVQGRLIGLFDDFGYRRIGIGCRLVNEVCRMSGLRSDANSFTIVEGAGVPRLTVVGHNRDVDWPTLVQRLAAVGKGEVSPVID